MCALRFSHSLDKAKLSYEPKYDIDGAQYTYKRTDPYSSHSRIIEWINRERPQHVLEVGTATGYLTSEMVKRGCTVTGIEQDSEMARIAEKYCNRMIVGDVESMDLSQLGTYTRSFSAMSWSICGIRASFCRRPASS